METATRDSSHQRPPASVDTNAATNSTADAVIVSLCASYAHCIVRSDLPRSKYNVYSYVDGWLHDERWSVDADRPTQYATTRYPTNIEHSIAEIDIKYGTVLCGACGCSMCTPPLSNDPRRTV